MKRVASELVLMAATLSLCLTSTHSLVGATTDCCSSSPEEAAAWQRYKARHGKNYTSETAECARCAVWKENRALIASHNALADNGNVTHRLGENQFADLTHEEYLSTLGYRSRSPGHWGAQRRKRGAVATESPACLQAPQGYYVGVRHPTGLPASVDWTAKGWVNPVQNQGLCGDCWAFAACGALEGQYYNVTGKPMIMSEQNLLDCSVPEGDEGCVEGGDMSDAFCYVYLNGGIDSEAAYPYTASQLTSYTPTAADCKYTAAQSVAKITGWENILPRNESVLQQAVAFIGPIAIGINGNPRSFQFYTSGVYNDSECYSTTLSHAALVVGYGTTSSGQAYWLIKNNWGVTWGIDGYMLLARNAGNMCGVATQASYPIGLQPQYPAHPPPPIVSSSAASLHSSSTTTPPSTTRSPPTSSTAIAPSLRAVIPPIYLYRLNGLVVVMATVTSLLTSCLASRSRTV